MKQGIDFLAIGGMHSADFDERTITIKVQGDMPPLVRGRYVIAHFDKFSSTVRMANLWCQAQADRSPEGQDGATRLDRNDESAVAASDAPKED